MASITKQITPEQAAKLGGAHASDAIAENNKINLQHFRALCSDQAKSEANLAEGAAYIMNNDAAKAYINALCREIHNADEQHTASPSRPNQTPSCIKSKFGCGI